MQKIKLEFISPTVLNSNVEKEKKLWNYSGIDGHILEIDLETLVIESSQDNIQELITGWVVDESNNSMKLKSDPDRTEYSEMTPQFAISMIGQLIKNINSYKPLQMYIDMILEAFEGASPFEKKDVNNE